MDADYSVEELLDFLKTAADRGLMPSATARALGVASRQVFESLDETERQDVRKIDLDTVIRRFGHKRAKDFNPTSLHEYGRRARKAVELFTEWRTHPAGFTVKTRVTALPRKWTASPLPGPPQYDGPAEPPSVAPATSSTGSYQSSISIRAGTVVTLMNIPPDLSKAEAERLAQFVRLLAVD